MFFFLCSVCACAVVFITGDGDRLECYRAGGRLDFMTDSVSEWSPSTGVGRRKLEKF